LCRSAAEEITVGLGDTFPFSAPARQSGVSAPVFDDRGRVTMVLCSLAFSSELNESTVADAGELIRESGLRLTERIGGVSPSAKAA